MGQSDIENKKGTVETAAVEHDPQRAGHAAEDAMARDAGHIDQIRDIIFGRQMSDYEQRFNTLENRLNNQIDKLKGYTDQRIEAITNRFEELHDALSGQLQTEKDERDRADSAVSTALDTLSDQQKKDIQRLGDQLLAISSQFSDELHILQTEAAKNLERAIQDLDEVKLARGALSRMFKEMAAKLDDTQDEANDHY